MSTNRKGLERFRLDLHVHTPGSKDWRGAEVDPELIVDRAIEQGLDAIAITDHETGEWIDRMKVAAAGTSLTIFPGVELSNLAGNQGVHLIVLFPLEASTADIDRFLSAAGALRGLGDDLERGTATRGIVEVLNEVETFHGIAVLAHCASSKGALAAMRGELRTQVVQHPTVLAAECTATDFHDATKAATRKRVADLLDGEDKIYARQLAVYQASDNPSGEGHGHSLIGIGSRYSYFWAEAPLSLESLRQCFVDRDARIEIPAEVDEPTPEPAFRISRLRITGGFLSGLDVELHAGLNTVLGAKGAGKSMLVELLRFCLDQPPTHPDILRDHEHKLKTKLGVYGRVCVDVASSGRGTVSYEREFNPEAGSPYHGSAGTPDGEFRAHFLSQGEVIRIAEGADEQIRFIDTFFDFEAFQQEIARTVAQLTALDGDVATQMHALKEERRQEALLPAMRDQIAEVSKSLSNPVFAKQQVAEAKARAVDEAARYLRDLRSELVDAYRSVELVPLPPDLDPALLDDPDVKELSRLQMGARDAALQHVTDASNAVAAIDLAATAKVEAVRIRHQAEAAALSAEIQKQGGDLAALNQQRSRLNREYATLQASVAKSKQEADLLRPTVDARNMLLGHLAGRRAAYTEARQARCAWFGSASDGKIRANVAPGADRESFRASLMGMKKGSYLSDSDIQAITDGVSPNELVRGLLRHALRPDPTNLTDIVAGSGLPADRVQRLADFLIDEQNGPGLDSLLRMQYAVPPEDRPSIEFRREDGTYSPLAELSTGQKSTALLVMALCDGERPIIVDQPEDSLDIRSIWEDMCVRLRKSKRMRQFLFTTHNSSLAVASDSDVFIIMQATSTHGEVALSGAIDSDEVRAEVISLLEGGESTYFLKQRKYNIGDPYLRRRRRT